MTTFILETDRLRMRPVTLEDIDEIHLIWTDPGIRKYLWDDEIIQKDRVLSVVETSVKQFEKNRHGLWIVLQRDCDEMIGFCGYWHFHDPPQLELLYGLLTEHWGEGFAPEMAKAMMRYGFEDLQFDRIVASTDGANAASVRVMEKCGMKFWKRENSNGLDTIYYSITKKG